MSAAPSGESTAFERDRFHRYVDGLLAAPKAVTKTYPDLPSPAWHDPAAFPVVAYLESAWEQIRAETAALDPAAFRPEYEPIARTGDWDVVFFTEYGMRREAELARCPGVRRAVDGFPVVSTPDGSVYVSRLRAGSRVAPHRGPTNVRVRCHLGLDVPDGDCAIRVDGETRRWEAGRCLVFDDSYEHEVWNATDRDRTVLILDLWNPALGAGEVAQLEALGRFVVEAAKATLGYWVGNTGPRPR